MRAMILAAGRGERMRPLTDATPKPLLEVGGKALIVWQIERLRDAGFRELVINHAWLGDKIEAVLGDGARFGVRIDYSREREALETAGGIAQALPLLAPRGDEPFLVVSGDLYTEFDYAAFKQRVLMNLSIDGLAAWLAMVPNQPYHPRGDYALAAHRLRMSETDRLTFGNIGVYAPRLFARIRVGDKVRWTTAMNPAIERGEVGGERFDGVWANVGTPQDLDQLNRDITARAA